MTRIAVSGCNGFIGAAAKAELESRGYSVLRLERPMFQPSARADLARQVEGCSAIIHCAGLTPRRGRHVSEEEFEIANHQTTQNVGLAAADAGVTRMVFVSSIAAVAGNEGKLAPKMPLHPTTPYGRSKARAETGLLDIDGLRPIIVRPPLVYGPGPKGDLNLLLRLCASPLPLPFGSVDNRRSMIGVTNMVDALIFLATSPAAGDQAQIVHATDDTTLSLREIVVALRKGLNRPPRLINIPPPILRAMLQVMGLGAISRKLLDDLEVDVSALLALGWKPPARPEFDLERMARAASRSA